MEKADKNQDRYHKYHIEAREAQDAARKAPYKKSYADRAIVKKVAKKIPHSENRMLKEHLKFMKGRKAEALNLGHYADERSIGSKTDKGYAETKYSPRKKGYINKWLS